MSSKADWLVRSGSIIKGPFSTEEIKEMIRSRELISCDEVNRAFGFWSFIKDQSVFKEVLAIVEAEQLHFNENRTSSLPDLETIPQKKTKKTTDKKDSKKADKKENHDLETHGKTKATYMVELASFSLSAQYKKIPKWLLAGLLFVVFAVSAYFFYKSYASELRVRETKVREIKDRAQQFFDSKDYVRALTSYENILKLDSSEDSIRFNYSLILIRNGQINKAKRVMKPLSGIEKKYLEVFLKTVNGDYSLALDLIEEALKLDPKNMDLRINKAALTLRKGSFNQASSDLLMIVEESQSEVLQEVLLLFAEANFKNWFNTRNKIYLTQAINILEKDAVKHSDYYPEVLIATAYFRYLAYSDYIEPLDALFKISPSDKKSIKNDLFLYPKIINLDMVGRWCQSLVEVMPNKQKAIHLKSYCLGL